MLYLIDIIFQLVAATAFGLRIKRLMLSFSKQRNIASMRMTNEDDEFRDGTCDVREAKVKTRTILAFGAFGFFAAYNVFVIVSAIQDILEATVIPSSLVLLAASGPAALLSVVYPYFLQRIPVSVASCVIFVLSVTGMLITSLVQEPRFKLIGVCLASFGYGGIPSVFLSLSAFYGSTTVTSFAIGMGIANVAGPLSYTGKYALCTQIISLNTRQRLSLENKF